MSYTFGMKKLINALHLTISTTVPLLHLFEEFTTKQLKRASEKIFIENNVVHVEGIVRSKLSEETTSR